MGGYFLIGYIPHYTPSLSENVFKAGEKDTHPQYI